MISNIKLQNYRNLSTSNDLDAHANVIIAPNGTGKSNFLESISMLSFNRSFRPVGSYAELIGPQEDFAKASMSTQHGLLEMIVSNTGRLQKKFHLNQKTRPFSKISGLLPAVIFAPHSVDLVAGEPAVRRNDLDDHLSLLDPNYRRHLKRYEKLLKNRNALLKNIREGFSQANELNYWTQELLKEVEPIMDTRLNFLDSITTHIANASASIYQDNFGELRCNYMSKHGDTTDGYLKHIGSRFAERQQVEIAAGQTLYGPHKDDYELQVDDKPLRYFGSRGQQRIAVFIWKYAQLLSIKSLQSDYAAIFLIDDLLSELDQRHKLLISKFLLDQHDLQFIITSADIRDVPQELLEANIVKL